nr:wall-associated receptor kinase-like 8 [Quercus suber]
MPIIYSRYCHVRPTGMEGNRSMSLEGSPFHFSGSYNTFISVGCDNFATVSGIAPTVFGCISDCTNTNIRETYISNCTGFMCCESTNVPSNLQEFAVDFRTISESISESTERSENCKFAFLVVKDRLLSNNSVKYSDDVPVVLEWAILKQTKNSPVMIRSLKYRHDVICNFSSNTFHCACASGYEGNPYLSTGCEDINECENHHLNNCQSKLDCENTEGSYSCNERKSQPIMIRNMILIGMSHAHYYFFIWKTIPVKFRT